MSEVDAKKLLVVVRRPPYGSGLARAALDTALATAAFEQPVDLLFLGDGVLQLLPGQDSRAIGVKNIGRLLASLPMYDIEQVYVDAEAACRCGLQPSDTPLRAEFLDTPAMRQLMADADHLMGF